MHDRANQIEQALTEVSRTRTAVKRRKSKQVTKGDEIDELKAVAFAWFRNHKPIVADQSSTPDLNAVDAAYSRIMESTGKLSARSTYIRALDAAKSALIALRTAVLNAPNDSPSTSQAPPAFAPLAADPVMQSILSDRWNEIQRCMGTKAYLAATVMMGGLLETLLLARINSSPNVAVVYTAKAAPKDKTGKTYVLGDWKLVHMVDVAHEVSWITKAGKDLGHVLRDFRNYIHPHKQFTDGVTIGEEDILMFWEVTKSICRQVLASTSRSP
jgi:hypothetical protein